MVLTLPSTNSTDMLAYSGVKHHPGSSQVICRRLHDSAGYQKHQPVPLYASLVSGEQRENHCIGVRLTLLHLQVRELIYRELLEYHPHMLADYLSGNRQQPSFMYPSAVDNFKRQFAHLEGGGAYGAAAGGGTPCPLHPLCLIWHACCLASP